MSEERPVRIWVDGCFDLSHYGHSNALLQAKKLFDGNTELVVGVHNDADIAAAKGPPLMSEEERYACVRAIEWVSEVVPAAPYTTQLTTLDEYNIDYVAHGDDITLNANGEDCYQLVKDAGRYVEFPRTAGVSTTDIIDRLMACIRAMDDNVPGVSTAEASQTEETLKSRYTRGSEFIATSAMIASFSKCKRPGANDLVMYVDGAWDLLNWGQISFLEQCVKFGEARAAEMGKDGVFLYVGCYDDHTVNGYKGYNLPICTLMERALSLMACRYVDDVVFDAPMFVSKDFIDTLKIDLVLHGQVVDQPAKAEGPHGDPYHVVKELGIFHVVESPMPGITTTELLDRVRANYAVYEERNRAKELKEIAREKAAAEAAAQAAQE